MREYKGTTLSNGFKHGVIVGVQENVSTRLPPNSSEDLHFVIVFEKTPTVETFIRIARTPGAVGFVIPQCSPYSHLAWAISYFNARTLVLDGRDLPQGDVTTFIDFDKGLVLIPETQQEAELLERAEASREAQQSHIQSRALLRAESKSGIRVEVMAQIQSPVDIALAKANGADGVGEIKSELMFDRSGGIDVGAGQIIRTIEAETNWRPIPLRFFDFTMDKAFSSAGRRNQQTLRYRGVRLLEIDESLLDSFLKALEGIDVANIVAVLPMVCLPSEVIRFRQRLGDGHFKIGVEVETPAAALLIRELLDVADYIVIGINDLTQFTMGWDRNVANAERLPADKLSEPVANLVRNVARAASECERFAALALDLRPSNTLVRQLLDLGVRAVTVSPRLVPAWKETIRSVD